MNTSLQWLGTFLPGAALDARRFGDALTNGGLPVENFIERGDGDVMLDVEVTSNRSDCLSHAGVARELAALLKLDFRDVKPEAKEVTTPVADVTSLRIDAPKLCPHYTARVIRGVKVGPSPAWMVKRLEAIGLRAINNVVDVTNYVMFEMGQPLHAFDFRKLAGGKIVVREAKVGETITSIDGHERKLTPGMLVIADADKPVALAGVMGGLASEVSNATVDVLLESARFDPLNVRRTARMLAMKSDSSYRFERGIDPTLPRRASLRAAQLIMETAGGELLAGIAEAGSEQSTPRKVSLRLERMRRLLGTEIPPNEAVDALRRLQLAPQLASDRIDVTVPSWRADVNIETDLIEEVARVVGYERIPMRDSISIVVTPPSDEARAMEKIRSTMVSAGFYEAVTFTFVSDLLAGDFLAKDFMTLPRADAAVRKSDARLRPSLLPGLLEAVRRNEANGVAGARLFETGPSFGVDAAGAVHESRKLALVGDDDLRATRGAVEALLEQLDATRKFEVIPDERAGFAAGACGRVEWGGQRIGYVGRIDPKVAEKLSLRGGAKGAATAAELDMPPLIKNTQHVPQLRPLPRFPAVTRDLSFVVADSTRYEAFDTLVRKLSLPDLEDVAFVTIYRGKQLEKGQKSLTITLSFRSPTTTLTSEAVEASVKRVADEAQKQLSATLRV